MATAPPRPDARLVRRLRERDRTAWEELYAAYGPRLRGYALRLAGNAHDADDLVQETFVRALPRLDRLDPDTVELAPYLFTTLRNTFLKGVERGGRTSPVEEVPEPEEPQPIEDDPVRGTLLRSQQEEVRVANARLAPRQRLVLALRELEDRSYAEIGAVVGLNENAVAQLISRARESLRTELRLAQLDPQRLPEECRSFLPLLSRHLDGQLKGEPLERTLAHVEGCERCQDALESMREASRRYRTLFPPLVGGEEAHAATIDLKLTSSGYWEARRLRLLQGRSRRTLGLAGAAVVAALAAAGAGVAILAVGEGSEPSEAALAAAAAATQPPESTTTQALDPAPPPPTLAVEAPETSASPEPPAPADAAPARPAPTTTARRTARPRQARPTTTRPTTTGRTTTRATATTRVPTTTAPRAAARTPTSPTTTRAAPPAAPPPQVTITARPPALTTETSASFSFRASTGEVTFLCRLDGAPFAPCRSPRRLAGLVPGVHVFAVRARGRGGNVGPAVTARWEVLEPDTAPPTVAITAVTTTGGDATFAFTASEPDVAFACSLDGGPFEPCASPKSYTGLLPGAHTFAVLATDPAGNVGPPAQHTWTVPRLLPDLVISDLTTRSFTVANIGTAPAGAFVVSVTLVGVFTFAGLAPGESVTRSWSPCRRGTITAVADRANTVEESDERNNVRSILSTC